MCIFITRMMSCCGRLLFWGWPNERIFLQEGRQRHLQQTKVCQICVTSYPQGKHLFHIPFYSFAQNELIQWMSRQHPRHASVCVQGNNFHIISDVLGLVLRTGVTDAALLCFKHWLFPFPSAGHIAVKMTSCLYYLSVYVLRFLWLEVILHRALDWYWLGIYSSEDFPESSVSFLAISPLHSGSSGQLIIQCAKHSYTGHLLHVIIQNPDSVCIFI